LGRRSLRRAKIAFRLVLGLRQLHPERDRYLAERDRYLAERDRYLAERDRYLAERNQLERERNEERERRMPDGTSAALHAALIERNTYLEQRDQAYREIDDLSRERNRLKGGAQAPRASVHAGDGGYGWSAIRASIRQECPGWRARSCRRQSRTDNPQNRHPTREIRRCALGDRAAGSRSTSSADTHLRTPASTAYGKRKSGTLRIRQNARHRATEPASARTVHLRMCCATSPADLAVLIEVQRSV
jgi:hypothetical protein